jgi:type I restriction enzyme, S subunit
MMGANLTDWQRLPIVSLCEAHVDCVNRTAPVVSEPTPFKMLRTTNVRNGYVDSENVRYVTEETYMKWTRRLVPRRGDVILTREAPLGDVGKIRTDDSVFLGQRLYHFRPDPKKLDADFLLYSLLGDDLQSQIKGFGSGSTVEHMRLEDIPNLEFNVPSLPIQRQIAGILSAYDELIENNQRRIRILEDMARSLYREWFVHFRYPGHESVPLVDSLLGQIPQGWEVKTLGALMLEQIGGGWGKDVPDEKHTEPAWVIRGTDIPDARTCQVENVPHRFHSVSNIRSRRLRAGDIIFEVSGGSKGQPVGRTLLATPQLLSALGDDAVICASFCKRICPDTAGYGSELLYLSFLEGYESGEIEQFQVQSTGISNFKWTEYLAKIERVIPSELLRIRFHDLVQPMLSQVATLGLQTANLRRTRDLLLPRLLSGQVALSADTPFITT